MSISIKNLKSSWYFNKLNSKENHVFVIAKELPIYDGYDHTYINDQLAMTHQMIMCNTTDGHL